MAECGCRITLALCERCPGLKALTEVVGPPVTLPLTPLLGVCTGVREFILAGREIGDSARRRSKSLGVAHCEEEVQTNMI